MSVVYATDRNVASKEVPQTELIPVINTWTRPADWLTLPTVGPTDQKWVGLYAVFNTTTNYVAFTATVSAGTYTVDWGDGSSPTTYSSGALAQYNYDYATISSGTLSSRGYKQVIITITPTTANLTTVDANQKYVPAAGYPALPRYGTRWLDITLGSPNLQNFNLPSSSTITANMLEQFTLVSKGTSFTDFTDSFYQLYALRKVNIDADMSNVTSTLSMFYGCIALEEVPYFDMSSNTTMQWMFGLCSSLKQIPQYNTSNVTSMAITFNNCRSLTAIPPLDFKKVTTLYTTFQGCSNLVKLPYIDTSNVTNAASAFESCFNLPEIPNFNLAKTTDSTNMFGNCASLTTVPALNTSNVTIAVNMFNNCSALTSVINLNTIKVSNAANMFSGCKTLLSAPELDLANVTVASGMFAACTSLSDTPEYNFANCTSANSMFLNCSALANVGNLTTPNLLYTTSMFNACPTLESVPDFDTSKVTIMTTMFSGCNNLKTEGLPSFNTANVTAMNGMFQTCSSLVTIPTFNTGKVTNFGAMFNSANTLATIPALNMSNATTAAATFAATTNSMGNCEAYGMKFAIDFSNSLMGKTNLETLFASTLGTPASAQTLTITSNPGADTAVAKTATWTTASRNVTITVAGSVVAGMYMYNATAIQAIACSFSTTTSKVTMSAGRLAPKNNTVVAFSNIGSTDLTINTLYYVVNSDWTSGSTFELATTPGGIAIGIGGVNSSGTTRYALKVESVVGTTVTLESYPMAAGTSAAVTFRYLNTNLASFRNWTVSG